MAEKQKQAGKAVKATDAGGGAVESAARPESPERFGWFDDWFDRWPSPFERFLPESMFRGISDAGRIRVEQLVEGNEIVIRAEIPGVDPDKDIEISVVGNRLTIAAERERREETEKDGRFHSEFHYGSFRRTLPLPQGTTAADVTARYADGILEVRAPLGGPTVESTTVPVTRGD